jgi:hypothetical protein
MENTENWSFFFNDVRVTKEEHERLSKEATEQHELLVAAKAKQVQIDKDLAEMKKTLEKERKKRKAAKEQKAVAKETKSPPVSETPKGGKGEIALAIVQKLGVKRKEEAVQKIMDVLGASRSNAMTYFANALRKI